MDSLVWSFPYDISTNCQTYCISGIRVDQSLYNTDKNILNLDTPWTSVHCWWRWCTLLEHTTTHTTPLWTKKTNEIHIIFFFISLIVCRKETGSIPPPLKNLMVIVLAPLNLSKLVSITDFIMFFLIELRVEIFICQNLGKYINIFDLVLHNLSNKEHWFWLWFWTIQIVSEEHCKCLQTNNR